MVRARADEGRNSSSSARTWRPAPCPTATSSLSALPFSRTTSETMNSGQEPASCFVQELRLGPGGTLSVTRASSELPMSFVLPGLLELLEDLLPDER